MYCGEGKSRVERRSGSHGAAGAQLASPPTPQGAAVHYPLRGPWQQKDEESCHYHLAQSDQGPPQEECNLGSKLKHNPKATREAVT